MYLIDANIFIQAQNGYYGIDICPGFWEWMTNQGAAGSLGSIAEVYKQFTPDNSECQEWKRRNVQWFKVKHQEADLAAAYQTINKWVESRSYRQAAKDIFYADPDYELIARAKAGAHTVVASEVPAPDAIKKVKIPDVCKGINVTCVDLFKVLRATGARFT